MEILGRNQLGGSATGAWGTKPWFFLRPSQKKIGKRRQDVKMMMFSPHFPGFQLFQQPFGSCCQWNTPLAEGLVNHSTYGTFQAPFIHGKMTLPSDGRMDLFRNYEKMEQIQCPVLVMHGTEDDIVPCRHGSGDLQWWFQGSRRWTI